MSGERIDEAAREIRAADSVVALTGAGVSTASGIPDFRGEDGLWNEYDPEEFHVRRFRADPGDFWERQLELQQEVFDAVDPSPNAAHRALADLEADGHLDGVVTQNVDGLHAEAGSEEPIRLHGTTERVSCQQCRQRYDAEPVRERAENGELPPRCGACDGVLKPDTVLFGEQLPEHALLRGHALAQKADVFLAVGSSLTVEPAASLPEEAHDRGASLLVVNHDPTPISDVADYDLRADVTDVLPAIRDRVLER
jgi:NAD-dependent deacetylase